MKRLTTGLLFTVGVCSMSIADEPETAEHRVSVSEVMVSAVMPATDTLWAVDDDPQTDEAWKALEDAAIVVIASGTLVRQGGAGHDDNTWASDPDWQAFADTMIGAGVDALQAIRDRDLDALLIATEVMYPPCEGCHIRFHPDMHEN